MITKKNINVLIIGLVVAAVIFTSVFMLHPQFLGIKAGNTEPEYADKLFNKEVVTTINIKADPDEWQKMLENATEEKYISCDLTINGETFHSVGIRPKGNSSLNMVAGSEDTDRFSFKIKMDEYVDGQSYYGLSKFVINNMQGDATYMKEYLSYDMFEYLGVKTPLYAFADTYVNGKPWGLYLAIESVEEEFAQRNYGADYGNLYKPESPDMGGATGGAIGFGGGQPPDMPQGGMPGGKAVPSGSAVQPGHNAVSRGGMQMGGAGGGADMIYTDDDTGSYSQIFDNAVFKTTKADKERIITALKSLATGEKIEKYVDVDEVLRYFAANTALVNLDSYICSFKHNFYLYEKDGQISVLPWDLNLSFAGFQSGNATSAVNFPVDTPVTGLELSERPLIGNLLENEEYKETYHEYLQDIVDGYFGSGHFEETIDKVDKLIGEYVKKDATAFYTYDQYSKAVDTLKEFGKLRAESIQGQIDGTIPSTKEGQTKDSSGLTDSSGITISSMGSQGNGGDVDRGTVFKKEN